ncbi:MAG: PaaI family thioesterase [Desulfamplus sp.]|nr:PaaI family thioesterase [Desulfamplus sp.]MBF0303606.1 PaaI family thioesterase [Desulfamplus sp.]MBF0413408.1 PaaI family thioesterase [Desulfamplus sp.]
MDFEKLSGLEILKLVANGVISPPTMAITIPMKLVSIENGACEFHVTANKMHLNPMGGVHGGFAATALDSATGCAVHTTLQPGESYGTIDLNVKMLKPIPQNEELKAIGKVIYRSRRIGVAEASLVGKDGKLYSHATATCMIAESKNER